MRFFTIITTFLLFATSFGQNSIEGSSNADTKRAIDRANKAMEEVKSLRAELQRMQSKNAELASTLSGMETKVSSEITRSQELQAQNERAMNLALDEFKKKFEEQNKTVEGVQASLDEKFNNQLIFFVIALVLFVFIAVISSKNASKKGLNQATANWNSFQEHILKK